MKSLPRKLASAKRLASALFGPVPVSRNRALAMSERISAGTSLVSSLEYLAHRDGMRQGGLNDWSIVRGVHIKSARPTRAALDVVGNDKATIALHVARVAASIGLIAPGKGRWRGAANVFLGVSNAVLYPRHRLGTDGSDQVASLVQSAAGLARMSRTPQVQDALMWYVALQSNLSYLVSGWVKLLGKPWRTGEALSGVMRTKTYGHEGFWQLTRKYPTTARYLAHGVLALECLFPIAYLRGGTLVRPIITSAGAFHVANGFLMGLGRFVTSFISMHPMVAYTSTPKDHPAVAGRDDRALPAAAIVAAGAVAGAAALAGARRLRATETWPGTRTVTTRHGNELRYDSRLRENNATPVVVFVAGMVSTPEHFGWLTEKLVQESSHDIITYSRAGYGPSRYRPNGREFTLQEAVDDLVDLVNSAVPAHRQVVFVGHSLGGELARRATLELGERVCGLVYLDSSHPAELQRSEQQSESAKKITEGMGLFVASLKLGMGATVVRPDWVDSLPPDYRKRVFAQYADSRLWEAGLREWKATERDFREFVDNGLPAVPAHAMVISAQKTVDRDQAQLLMHNELADAHRANGKIVRNLVVEGADHDSLLTDARQGTEVGRQILEFVDEISRESANVSGSVREAS